uniref:Uncharacterized protein n=1 Tax=Onchocerca volvulus TaxID=6282 RepID=A0A8R1Y3D2_ONCVO
MPKINRIKKVARRRTMQCKKFAPALVKKEHYYTVCSVGRIIYIAISCTGKCYRVSNWELGTEVHMK